MCTGGGVGGTTASSKRRALEDDICGGSVSEIVRDSVKTNKKKAIPTLLSAPAVYVCSVPRRLCFRGAVHNKRERERISPPHVRKRSGMAL